MRSSNKSQNSTDKSLQLKNGKACEGLREVLRYVFFGALTTLVNIGIYRLLLPLLDYQISNLIAILSAKLFAYVTNKIFVFRSKCASTKELLGEISRFIAARGFTGLVDYFGLIAAVELFHYDPVYSKYVLQVIVIILNYVLGKKAVYLNAKSTERNG